MGEGSLERPSGVAVGAQRSSDEHVWSGVMTG
jgi:hypothetical protein